MARPREFDEATVLGRARDLLWIKGVNATSINELSEAMQLSVGSIYKAFGSKDALVERVLGDYLDAAVADMATQLASGSTALEGLDRFLEALRDDVSGDGPTKGCFAVNCSIERAAADPEVADRLRRHDDAIVALLEQGLARVAAEEGRDLDVVTGAGLLYATINGLQVASRKGVSRERAERVLALARSAAVGVPTQVG